MDYLLAFHLVLASAPGYRNINSTFDVPNVPEIDNEFVTFDV